MKKQRNKKWIGAAVGLVSQGINLVTNLISKNKQAKAEEKARKEQIELLEKQKAEEKQRQINQVLNSQLADSSYIDEFQKRIEFKKGGKIKHKIEAENGEIIKSDKPMIIRNGGVAIPLGNGYNLLKGKTHEQGGIDIDLKGDGRVWSDVPFLNGESPARKVLKGENPNKVFIQQEIFKKVNKIKDDGTKKRYGGEDDKYKPKILKDDNYKYEHFDPTKGVNKIFKQIHTPKTYMRKIPLNSLSRSELNYIKDNDSIQIFKDKDNIEYLDKSKVLELVKDILGLTEINKDSAVIANRKNLDYIGGTEEESIRKMINKMPETMKEITSIAKQYNINPNVLIHRLGQEGAINDFIKDYNYNYNKEQQSNIDSSFFEESYNGFKSFGLDHTGSLLKQGKVKLKHPIDWWDFDAENENGIKVNAATSDNNYGNVILQAATMEYIKNELLKRKDIPKEDIDMYTNAAYNLGLNHKDLKETNWIKRNYTVPDYNNEKKKYGGNMNKNSLIYNLNGNVKNKNGFVPSTGKRQKAKLGIGGWMNIGSGILNVAGGLGSYFMNRKALKDMENTGIGSGPEAPVAMQANKLNTNYNINPQLSAIREAEANAFKDIDQNTTSSSVALARKQQARLNSLQNRNALYAEKENRETELINADRLNQQQISAQNNQAYNQYLKDKYNHQLKEHEFKLGLIDKRGENNIALVQNLTGAINNVGDYFTRKEENDEYIKLLKEIYTKRYGGKIKR